MKYFALLVSLLLLTITSCKKERDCADFRTGTFAYVDKNLSEEIIRTEILQIEKNPETGLEIHTSVEWTSDCTYVLTYQRLINYDGDPNKVIGKKIYVEILETKDNWYRVHAKSEAIDDDIEFVKVNN